MHEITDGQMPKSGVFCVCVALKWVVVESRRSWSTAVAVSIIVWAVSFGFDVV